NLDRIAFQLFEQIDFIRKSDSREEGDAALVSMLFELAPFVRPHRPASKDIVKRLGDRLGSAALAVDEDFIAEWKGFVGDQSVRIKNLELDRIAAGLGCKGD